MQRIYSFGQSGELVLSIGSARPERDGIYVIEATMKWPENKLRNIKCIGLDEIDATINILKTIDTYLKNMREFKEGLILLHGRAQTCIF